MPRKKTDNTETADTLKALISADVSAATDKTVLTSELDPLFEARVKANKVQSAAAEAYKTAKAEVEALTGAINSRIAKIATLS